MKKSGKGCKYIFADAGVEMVPTEATSLSDTLAEPSKG